jgi:serine/threonine protein kinase
VGVLLYWMLFGKPTFVHRDFNDKDDVQLARDVFRGDWQAAIPMVQVDEHSLGATISEQAIDLIKKCLRFKPEERPSLTGIEEHAFFGSDSVKSFESAEV